MAVNVSAQRNRDVSGQIGGADHIRSEAEREVARATARALDALMKAQHAHIRRRVVATRSSEYLRKSTANIVRVREPDERDADSACVEDDAARPVENMQALMYCKQRIRDAASFV